MWLRHKIEKKTYDTNIMVNGFCYVILILNSISLWIDENSIVTCFAKSPFYISLNFYLQITICEINMNIN
jgi:hypothetical protein